MSVNVEEDPDYKASSSEENNLNRQQTRFTSKNGKLSKSCSPLESQGRICGANVIETVPGPSRYAVSHVQDKISICALCNICEG